jgi:hypothetical protein
VEMLTLQGENERLISVSLEQHEVFGNVQVAVYAKFVSPWCQYGGKVLILQGRRPRRCGRSVGV